MFLLLTNLQIAMTERIKLVRLKEKTFTKLKNAKFDYRVDTFDQAVDKLIEEHTWKQEPSA